MCLGPCSCWLLPSVTYRLGDPNLMHLEASYRVGKLGQPPEFWAKNPDWVWRWKPRVKSDPTSSNKGTFIMRFTWIRVKYYRLNIQNLGQHLPKYVLYKAMWSGLNNDWGAVLGLIQPPTLRESHPVSLVTKTQQWMDGWMDPRFIRLSCQMGHVIYVYSKM